LKLARRVEKMEARFEAMLDDSLEPDSKQEALMDEIVEATDRLMTMRLRPSRAPQRRPRGSCGHAAAI
jgi:hypothetical protein